MGQFYRMLDVSPDGMFEISASEASDWNRQGFGIFATVQSFRGPRRIENLERIRAWAIDLDAGTKAEQRKRILECKLLPSSIVETKNGFHCYWYAKDASKENYRTLLDRLIAFFGADKRARDLARVLRVPGYWHLKNPAEPFLVRHAYGPHRDRSYSERDMSVHFPAPREKAQKAKPRPSRVHSTSDDFWDRIYKLDCRDALERLSGSGYVNGEHFTFQPVAGGARQNIVVDGKGTSTWIDENGRIGSLDNGGPTIFDWLKWYGTSPSECARILKELYPELDRAQ